MTITGDSTLVLKLDGPCSSCIVVMKRSFVVWFVRAVLFRFMSCLRLKPDRFARPLTTKRCLSVPICHSSSFYPRLLSKHNDLICPKPDSPAESLPNGKEFSAGLFRTCVFDSGMQSL